MISETFRIKIFISIRRFKFYNPIIFWNIKIAEFRNYVFSLRFHWIIFYIRMSFFFLIKIPINHSRRRKIFRKNNDPSNYFYFSNRYILHKILEIYRCPYTSLFTSFFSFQAWKRLSSWCRPRVVLVTVMFAICATKKTFTRKRN